MAEAIGLDAHAGERGVNLSDGQCQRQRSALALVLLKDAPILTSTTATQRLRGYRSQPPPWHGQVIGWDELGVTDGWLQIEIGFATARTPGDTLCLRELPTEPHWMATFVGIGAADGVEDCPSFLRRSAKDGVNPSFVGRVIPSETYAGNTCAARLKSWSFTQVTFMSLNASIKRGLLAGATLLALAAPGTASASLVFSFSGTCDVSCSRFGIADGTSFTEAGALKLLDGTDTSAGTTLLIGSIESFTLFGLDFLTGNYFSPIPTWVADNVLGGFTLVGGANQFCYDATASTCAGGRWDTIVGSSSSATGFLGHGPGHFSLAANNVPEPHSAALLVVALAGLLASRRRLTRATTRTA
jgi:hypothetical protein